MNTRKTRISLLLAIAIIFSMTMTAGATAIPPNESFKIEVTIGNTTVNLADYAKKVVAQAETTPFEVIGSVPLYNLETEEEFATYLILSTGGYIIVDNSSLFVYEYAIDHAAPYKGNDKWYYVGVTGYYMKGQDGKNALIPDVEPLNTFTQNNLDLPDEVMKQLEKNTEISTANVETYDVILEDSKAFYHATEEYNSIEQALELLNKVENSQIAARSAYASGALLHPTSMDFVNGSCIPTTAYVMLNYRGLIPSGENYIHVMDNYITYGNLTYMRIGMNQYLQDSGQSSIAWVNSSSYSLALIQTHINNDRPISLGLNANDQLNTGGGHAVTVTGYYWNYSSGYVMLTVNNSWGYSSTLTYYSYNTPSWLVDHIYFQY